MRGVVYRRIWLIAVIVVGLAVMPRAATAQPASIADWQPTGLAGPIFRLIATADGALFAQTAANVLQRSDDGGTTFRPIQLLPTVYQHEVDPTSANVLYVVGEGDGREVGLYKSIDGGASFDLILAGSIMGMSASPADPTLIYVVTSTSARPARQFLRSRDGGASFEVLGEHPGCQNSVFDLHLLAADAVDPRRVWRSASCVAGRNLGDPRPLERSEDQGATWTEVARPRGFLNDIVRAHGTQSGRYYLTTSLQGRSWLYRSDDGGDSFAEWFAFPSLETEPPGGIVFVSVGGIAVDPATPDRVFVGRRRTALSERDLDRAPPAGGVLVSDDGGRTFAPLGRDIGEVLDVALSADGQTLYAATWDGPFRLTLHPARSGAPVQVPPVP